jgi:hypothetical protein
LVPFSVLILPVPGQALKIESVCAPKKEGHTMEEVMLQVVPRIV